jgi:hypothetical protein
MATKKPKLAVIKTKQNKASVEDFINSIKDEQQRKDSFALLEMMKKISGEEPKMWGSSLIGFGNKIYTSPTSGRQVDWMLIGFAPRKGNLSLHLMMNILKQETVLDKLGKYKTGSGCLYINKLEDVDLKVLKGIIAAAYKQSKINS